MLETHQRITFSSLSTQLCSECVTNILKIIGGKHGDIFRSLSLPDEKSQNNVFSFCSPSKQINCDLKFFPNNKFKTEQFEGNKISYFKYLKEARKKLECEKGTAKMKFLTEEDKMCELMSNGYLSCLVVLYIV